MIDGRTLEIFKRTLEHSISAEFAGQVNVEVDFLSGFARDFISVRAAQRVAGERVAAIEIPDGAWQWIKSILFPLWLLRKYPVRVRSLTLVRFYPEIQPLPGKAAIEILDTFPPDPNRQPQDDCWGR